MIIFLATRPFQVGVSGAPTYFKIQEIRDPTLDWINMKTRLYTDQGEGSTDILAVNYYTFGNTLNATLWLYTQFNAKPPTNDRVDYGMYIDADFNNRTGYQGIDYQLEIKWNNTTRSWTKTLEAWSPNGEQKTINLVNNYTGFFEQGKKYVTLSLNLSNIGSPEKYKLIFYAESKKEGGVLLTDFTKWVAIPPLQLTISTTPNSIEVRKGEEKTIEVRVTSSQGYEPIVNIYAKSPASNINFEFKQNDTLRISTYGVATTPLTINVSKDVSVGPYTLFLFANSTFPPEELIKPRQSKSQNSDLFPHVTPENIITQSSIPVTILEPLTWIDIVSDLWKKIGNPITFMYGILAGLSPWIYGRIKDRRKKEK